MQECTQGVSAWHKLTRTMCALTDVTKNKTSLTGRIVYFHQWEEPLSLLLVCHGYKYILIIKTISKYFLIIILFISTFQQFICEISFKN